MDVKVAARAAAAESGGPHGTCCPVLEFRQYTLRPGRRDALIELFDREFVEAQEAVGMVVIGQFRDLDDPDRFVFIRGFRDMPSRARALAAFYDGPVWAAHRDAANATMIDFSNVLLLRPARPTAGFALGGDRPAAGTTGNGSGLVVATTYRLDRPAEDGFVDVFEETLAPVLRETGAAPLASFVTEPSANTYPRLPVREGERVFAWFAGFSGPAAYEEHVAALARSGRWRGGLADELARRGERSEVRRLVPTARSLLHG